MWFVEDLKNGEKYEGVVIETLNKNGYNVIKNPDSRWMDLIILENGIEVKKDFGAKDTWNAFIEYECNGIPAWIMKEDNINLKFWVHSVSDSNFFMLDGDSFRTFVADKVKELDSVKGKKLDGYRLVKWWDGWRVKGLLIPIGEMEKMALNCYNT